MIATCLLLFSFSLTAFGMDDNDDRTSCKNNKSWTGSYSRPVEIDGVKYAFQVQFSADGLVTAFGSYYEERTLSTGTSTPGFGKWKCRDDGRISATIIFGNYGYPESPIPELTLFFHARTTTLIAITDANTLTQLSTVWRTYERGEDPTDPNGGTLQPINVESSVFTKMTVSDDVILN
jgi:hypothetical protein